MLSLIVWVLGDIASRVGFISKREPNTSTVPWPAAALPSPFPNIIAHCYHPGSTQNIAVKENQLSPRKRIYYKVQCNTLHKPLP